MVELPTGTVTFLFTDVEGSTRLWESDPDGMRDALARHDGVLHVAIASHAGQVVKTTGDGFHAVFATAGEAVQAAIEAQRALEEEASKAAAPLRVRMGIHTGEAIVRDGDYYGTVLNRAARLMSIAHGGQVVVSQVTGELARDSGIELVDLGEHRLRDLGYPEHVYQVADSGLPRAFPPLRSLEHSRTNLPLQTTSFIGRDEDMAAVIELLSETRLVTLTGVGGVGKTRLAIQVGADLLPRFHDGVWLCELGPLKNGDGIGDALAGTLSVRPRPDMTMLESVIEWLRSRDLLVIVDNCEHLIRAAADAVDRLLTECPGICILATSREGLGVRGERQTTVRSLDLVDEAPRLFLDRAQLVGRTLDTDPQTTEAVTQICRRLDGIPLALELAAARTRMMGPAEIADRLDERFRLLTGGSRTSVERHQTLRQAVDWSYDLLVPQEQEMLNRLGVFVNGFTLEAAEGVVGSDDLDAIGVFEGIADLVDKSLVVTDWSGIETRYRLLETIRQYALERLEDASQADEARQRHARWFVDFGERERVSVIGPHELQTHERIDREVDNLRAALTWALEQQQTDIVFRLIAAVPFHLMVFRDRGYQLAPYAAPALRMPGAQDHPQYAVVVALRSLDHQNHGRFEEAERDAWAAIHHMRHPGHPWVFEAWGALWSTLIFTGRAADFLPLMAEVLEQASESGNAITVFTARNLVVGTLFAVGRASEGIELGESNMALADEINSQTLKALAAFALGGALAEQEPDRARELLRSSAEHGRKAHMDYMTAMARARLARMTDTELDEAWARDFRAGVDLSVDSGDPRTLFALLELFGQVLAANDRPEPAVLLLSHWATTSTDATNPVAQIAIERWRRLLTEQLGDAQYGQLWTQGSLMPTDDAVALMRAELDQIVDPAPDQ